MRWAALAAVAACGGAGVPSTTPSPSPPTSTTIDAGVSQQEVLAAIQKAMNDLVPVSQQCWARAATQNYAIAGKLTLRIAVDGPPSVHSIDTVEDTTGSGELVACMYEAIDHYPWPPPLAGQVFQLPFQFDAPHGQSVIDRRLVSWQGQVDVSVAVLLDEANTGNPAASMFEVAIKAGGHTGFRRSERAELWYFLGPAEITVGAGPEPPWQAVAAGDIAYVPAGGVRDVRAPARGVHAVVVMLPGGREGTARAGALPAREWTGPGHFKPGCPVVVPAGKPFAIAGAPLAARVLDLPAGTTRKAAHAHQTELWYVLSGAGELQLGDATLAVQASAIQIPPGTPYTFQSRQDTRVLQILTPAGPDQP